MNDAERHARWIHTGELDNLRQHQHLGDLASSSVSTYAQVAALEYVLR